MIKHSRQPHPLFSGSSCLSLACPDFGTDRAPERHQFRPRDGFGDSFRDPLRLDERGEQPEGVRAFRIDEDGDQFLLLRRDGPGEPWQPQYRFTLQSYEYPDYADMCHFHQTSPESHFTRQTLCSLTTPEGRITLSGMRLITTHGGERQEIVVESEEERSTLLRELFDVVI
jgi:N-hydroxyarylamine O-acetyltransferase